LGVNQHHDAITGTAKQHVANDYVYLLSKAMSKNNDLFSTILKDQTKRDIGLMVEKYETCVGTNGTVFHCPAGQESHKDQDNFLVTVQNTVA